jgi:hypothetical protein
MTTTPRRIEYSGPEGWTVWTDEDGVHVRTPHGDGLESCDLARLIELVNEANRQRTTGYVPAPKPPTREQRGLLYEIDREEREAKRASRAVYQALSPTTDNVQPF